MNRVISAIVIVFGWASSVWAAQPPRVRALPVTPFEKLSAGVRERDLPQRVRVHGVITYYEPGKAVVLEDGSRSVWVATTTATDDLRVNDAVDAIGTPVTQNGLPALADGEIWDNREQAVVSPQPVTLEQLVSASHPLDLVSLEGVVISGLREPTRDEYVLSAGGQLFRAVLIRLGQTDPSTRLIPPGTRVQLTGICIPANSDPSGAPASVEILLRAPGDIAIVARPSLLAIRSPSILFAPMLLAILALAVWGWTYRARARRQAARLATLAYLDQRRSRILGDINSSKPLAEIIEKIAEMVSFMLDDAPCWCDIKDGARLGNCPADLKHVRVLQEEIPARSGPPLGSIVVAVDSGGLPIVRRTFSREREALSVGSKLAMLAMETRRLYSDLRQRSEVDLLTNVHNRLSLGERMDALIEEARQNASVFGLIYIDLDKFKPINDTYGHHVGDLFLQEVTVRMKQQLRSHDLLARLGGDEFAVLLPMVRNRTRIEEIALRLEHCFVEPFAVEGNVIHGSASFGYAIYPEDGATKNELLRAADAAMYAAKNFRKQSAAQKAGHPNPAPAG